MNDLIKAMSEVNDLNRTHGVVQRGGKKYTEVFVRVEAFRKAFGTTMGITTDIVVDDGQRVVMKAQVMNDKGMAIGSGYAEEIRGQGNVNRTSALENAETSAIGRALASLGLHGGAYASSFEIEVAQRNDKALHVPKEPQKLAHDTPPPTDPVIRMTPEEALTWCQNKIGEYNRAVDLRSLQDIDRNTPDNYLDCLKQDYPDYHQRLVLRFTEAERKLSHV
jgi:hypothetical protein